MLLVLYIKCIVRIITIKMNFYELYFCWGSLFAEILTKCYQPGSGWTWEQEQFQTPQTYESLDQWT